MTPKEAGVVIGTIEFVQETASKIRTFLKAHDVEAATKHLDGLSLILEAQKSTIRKMID